METTLSPVPSEKCLLPDLRETPTWLSHWSWVSCHLQLNVILTERGKEISWETKAVIYKWFEWEQKRMGLGREDGLKMWMWRLYTVGWVLWGNVLQVSQKAISSREVSGNSQGQLESMGWEGERERWTEREQKGLYRVSKTNLTIFFFYGYLKKFFFVV